MWSSLTCTQLTMQNALSTLSFCLVLLQIWSLLAHNHPRLHSFPSCDASLVTHCPTCLRSCRASVCASKAGMFVLGSSDRVRQGEEVSVCVCGGQVLLSWFPCRGQRHTFLNWTMVTQADRSLGVCYLSESKIVCQRRLRNTPSAWMGCSSRACSECPGKMGNIAGELTAKHESKSNYNLNSVRIWFPVELTRNCILIQFTFQNQTLHWVTPMLV